MPLPDAYSLPAPRRLSAIAGEIYSILERGYESLRALSWQDFESLVSAGCNLPGSVVLDFPS